MLSFKIRRISNGVNWTGVGLWVWGGVTVVLALFFLFIVVGVGWYIDRPDGEKFIFICKPPQPMIGIFYALKANGSLVAGILGFSGLAWSHFFKANQDGKG